ncbi:MAG: Ig-like domain-containing protein [Cyclobacteriaceae bacterium]
MKYILALLLITTLTHCGSDNSEAVKVLTRIEIVSSNGSKLDILTPETTQLTVNGFDQDNIEFPITETISWSIDNANASIDQTGLVTALVLGSSTVTAKVETVESTFKITVWDSSAPRTEIYVSDAGSPVGSGPFQVLKYDENGENPEIFIGENLGWPQDILFLENDGHVLISNLNDNSIRRHDIETGAFVNNFASGINGPTRIKIGPDNLLYALQWTGNGKVHRYELDGTFVDEFTSVGVTQSIGLDWDSGGNLYVASFSGKTIRKFDTSGNDQGIFISSSLQGPTDIWFDSGDLWVNDWQSGTIKRFDSNGSFVETVVSGLSQNEGIDFLKSGDFLIGNGGTGAVKMYGSNGSFKKDLVSSGSGGLKGPNAVRVRNVNQ